MNKIILSGLILLILSSCSDNDECLDVELSVKHIDCPNSKYALQVDINNDFMLISSKESYDNLVSGDCHPSIDFSQYDLLIGKKSSGNENDTIKYNLHKICTDQKLVLTIDIIQSAATRPDNVVYNALIPKLGEGETLEVNINLQ